MADRLGAEKWHFCLSGACVLGMGRWNKYLFAYKNVTQIWQFFYAVTSFSPWLFYRKGSSSRGHELANALYRWLMLARGSTTELISSYSWYSLDRHMWRNTGGAYVQQYIIMGWWLYLVLIVFVALLECGYCYRCQPSSWRLIRRNGALLRRKRHRLERVSDPGLMMMMINHKTSILFPHNTR